MNLLDFLERFHGEKECLEYYIAIRQKTGIICQKCGCNNHNWVARINQFECYQCKNRLSIKRGTVMENSKLPIKYWFIAIHLLTSSIENLTIAEIKKKLGFPEHEQINEMLGILNLLISRTDSKCSFDELIFACVDSQNKAPSVNRSVKNNCIKRQRLSLKKI